MKWLGIDMYHQSPNFLDANTLLVEGKTITAFVWNWRRDRRKNILNGNKSKIITLLVPSVVFTQPQIATIGQSEEEAKKRYKKVIVNAKSLANKFNARRLNAPVYPYKVILNERTGKILGATILGPEAGEMINLFTIAINQGMTSSQIVRTVFTYPSWGNDIKSMVAI